jgi:hypothetical protein
MTDVERIRSSLQLVMTVLEEESPKCPMCSNEMTLSPSDDLMNHLLELTEDDEDDEFFVAYIEYNCAFCDSALKSRLEINKG